MLLNGSMLGSLFGWVGSILTQQNNQTSTNTATEEPTSNTVTETTDVADSGGTKFDFSSAVSGAVETAASTTGNTVGSVVSAAAGGSTDSGSSGTQSAGDDDNTLSAYFYAAKWAKSIQAEVAEEVPADADAGKSVSFATEPYRHDVMSQYFTEQTVHFGGKKLATIGANGVLTLADASQATNNPYQAQKSFGSF